MVSRGALLKGQQVLLRLARRARVGAAALQVISSDRNTGGPQESLYQAHSTAAYTESLPHSFQHGLEVHMLLNHQG
jgi:hypothetical protein